METARCRAVLAAAETGSFSRAAEVLRYTPSGVNQLVTAFENQLDKLFQSDALDVSADVAALEGMLNMDGLTGSDFAKYPRRRDLLS